MKTWPRRISTAVLMGLAWAVAWVPIAILIGTKIVDPDNSMDEMWFLVGAYPGFLCGAIFTAVAGIASGRRRLDALSLPRSAAWGALSGLLVGVIPFLLGDQEGDRPLWILPVVVICSFTLLSAVSAVVSALVARRAKKGELRGVSAGVA